MEKICLLCLILIILEIVLKFTYKGNELKAWKTIISLLRTLFTFEYVVKFPIWMIQGFFPNFRQISFHFSFLKEILFFVLTPSSFFQFFFCLFFVKWKEVFVCVYNYQQFRSQVMEPKIIRFTSCVAYFFFLRKMWQKWGP